MGTAVLREALTLLPILRERDAEWEQAVIDAAKQGFRPHYCKHGVNLWTDYDPICLACEEGLTIYEEALAAARFRLHDRAARAALEETIRQMQEDYRDVRR